MTIDNSKLLWQCRRGMLELDLLLIPFAEKKYASLLPKEKIAFENLLTYPDPVIYEWILGNDSPTDPELSAIVQHIKNNYTAPFL